MSWLAPDFQHTSFLRTIAFQPSVVSGKDQHSEIQFIPFFMEKGRKALYFLIFTTIVEITFRHTKYLLYPLLESTVLAILT